jgi:hypothetical protein
MSIRVSGFRFHVSEFGFRVPGFGFRGSGSRFRDSGSAPPGFAMSMVVSHFPAVNPEIQMDVLKPGGPCPTPNPFLRRVLTHPFNARLLENVARVRTALGRLWSAKNKVDFGLPKSNHICLRGHFLFLSPSQNSGVVCPYRGTSLIRKSALLGPYRTPMSRVVGGSWWGGRFLMGEVPLYTRRGTYLRVS